MSSSVLSKLCLAFLLATTSVVAFSALSRRQWLASTGAIVGTTAGAPWMAQAADDSSSNVYFGVGCFWHIQHEFIQAEKELLGRSNPELTSIAGYAGGRDADKVCYHNLMGIGDYGKLGHAEVVGMQLPPDRIVDFGKVYFSLFNPKTQERVDPQDRGAEYRSAMGLPGGIQHPQYEALRNAAASFGLKLTQGQGSDPDTLGKKLIYVYDNERFPFYPGEVYHQYHNDFQSPAYGKAYNQLADIAFAEGRLQTTGCPDRV